MLKEILQVRNYLTRIAIFKSLFHKKYMYIEEYFIVERLLINTVCTYYAWNQNGISAKDFLDPMS